MTPHCTICGHVGPVMHDDTDDAAVAQLHPVGPVLVGGEYDGDHYICIHGHACRDRSLVAAIRAQRCGEPPSWSF